MRELSLFRYGKIIHDGMKSMPWLYLLFFLTHKCPFEFLNARPTIRNDAVFVRQPFLRDRPPLWIQEKAGPPSGFESIIIFLEFMLFRSQGNLIEKLKRIWKIEVFDGVVDRLLVNQDIARNLVW
jgi:hypothetical protein